MQTIAHPNAPADRPHALWHRAFLALAALLISASTIAEKPPTLIRQHLLEQCELEVARVKSVEPVSAFGFPAPAGESPSRRGRRSHTEI
jgi:hypothetical protein